MRLRNIFYLLAFSIFILSCNSDDNYEYVEVGVPLVMTKADFRASTSVLPPQNIVETGKIYTYNNYIFVSDVEKGVHIIDNSNPENPQAIKFINIPGNNDISVKNNFLYANSFIDLMVFDISDINAIKKAGIVKDVFYTYETRWPTFPVDDIDFGDVNFEEEIITGWTSKTEKREIEDDDDFNIAEPVFDSAESGGNTGQGGSLARFQIVDDYLYTVGSSEMNIFNIEDLTKPTLSNTQYIGWDIETLFYAEDYLYIGSTRGMYIYGIGNPSAPEYVSEFTHWEGCDPVVVDGDYAYLTLRGGNACGQLESVLEVIDIKDKTAPTLAARHTLENPYGLGIKDNTLFVCDGTAGLKLYDKTNPLDLKLTKEYANIQSKDVIPLENSLMMIGGQTVYQYKYLENDLELINAYELK